MSLTATIATANLTLVWYVQVETVTLEYALSVASASQRLKMPKDIPAKNIKKEKLRKLFAITALSSSLA